MESREDVSSSTTCSARLERRLQDEERKVYATEMLNNRMQQLDDKDDDIPFLHSRRANSPHV